MSYPFSTLCDYYVGAEGAIEKMFDNSLSAVLYKSIPRVNQGCWKCGFTLPDFPDFPGFSDFYTTWAYTLRSLRPAGREGAGAERKT